MNRNCDPVALLLTVMVLGFPMTQWIGICDHWPAWQVYSPSSSRARLLNRTLTAEGSSSQPSLPQLSLDELGVPIYPQSRFQLAVAIAIIEKSALNSERAEQKSLQIELGQQSNRLTGERPTETLTGSDQFKMKASRFGLNTKARRLSFD